MPPSSSCASKLLGGGLVELALVALVAAPKRALQARGACRGAADAWVSEANASLGHPRRLVADSWVSGPRAPWVTPGTRQVWQRCRRWQLMCLVETFVHGSNVIPLSEAAGWAEKELLRTTPPWVLRPLCAPQACLGTRRRASPSVDRRGLPTLYGGAGKGSWRRMLPSLWWFSSTLLLLLLLLMHPCLLSRGCRRLLDTTVGLDADS